MAETSELIEFRRAFVWLLCGMLLPSVALVAFGVVAVANERAAVERRLAEDYDARLRALGLDLLARLDKSAEAVAAGKPDPLVLTVQTLGRPPPELADAARRAATLPIGGHVFANAEMGSERRALALVRTGGRTLIAHFDVAAVAELVPRLAEARFPRERAAFRLFPPREPVAALAALRRIVAEAGQTATVVSRVGLGPPLEGFALAAELPGDPAAPLAFRNRTLYIALLVLLYLGIGVGFGLTIREMRRAYKLSRMKTDFVANISHELRTPLTGVRLFAETLRAGRAEGPEEVRQCVAMLSTEADRLSRMVEKLLDWSRLEAGRTSLELERTEVPALLDRIGQAYRAQQLPASYQTELDPQLPPVNVDRDAMAQVVLNLLHNAVKYTGEDKRIRVRARRAGRNVAIEVEDNGPGVRPHERKRIFERFYRADDLLSRQTEGTGLGLAIAKRIVELHGGRIELDSRVGQGSTFRVLLPAA
ncbi:MAG: two-component sensor histidine kinase [Deltaproteobacteria bacterium]|nr:MAG: two-component sensor histidine kinase [Deltaproteobacteria bacterium]